LDKSDTEAETMPAIPGYAHLAQDPGYNGGAPRVAAAGVRVYSIWLMYHQGMSPKDISEQYEGLELAAVFSALAYAADHADEIEAYMKEEAASTNELLKDYVPLIVRKAISEHPPVLS
jgi:uncharacterized protein (DUF433 family)